MMRILDGAHFAAGESRQLPVADLGSGGLPRHILFEVRHFARKRYEVVSSQGGMKS
jgi:hypothetical protein